MDICNTKSMEGISMNYLYKKRIKCSVCNRKDEGYLLLIYLLGFWLIERAICERCISNMFKGLHKELKL